VPLGLRQRLVARQYRPERLGAAVLVEIALRGGDDLQ
jgi:hypothetical protein